MTLACGVGAARGQAPSAGSSHPQTDNDAGFAAGLLFAQANPTSVPPNQGVEAAGVQAASITPDRTAILIQIIPQLEKIVPAIGAMIPSTGGPGAVAIASTLVAIGGAGVWMRRAGRRRGAGRS